MVGQALLKNAVFKMALVIFALIFAPERKTCIILQFPALSDCYFLKADTVSHDAPRQVRNRKAEKCLLDSPREAELPNCKIADREGPWHLPIFQEEIPLCFMRQSVEKS